MDGLSSDLNIPRGHVQRRIERFSEDSANNDHTTSKKATRVRTQDVGGGGSKDVESFISSSDGQDDTKYATITQAQSLLELDAMKAPELIHVPRNPLVNKTAARDTIPIMVHDDATQACVQDEVVIEDVRQRLESLQHIVRREQNRSSAARDGVMDELGDMLDSAIATTMVPASHYSFQLSRSASMISTHPPSKLPQSKSRLSRSQNLQSTARAEKPSMAMLPRIEDPAPVTLAVMRSPDVHPSRGLKRERALHLDTIRHEMAPSSLGFDDLQQGLEPGTLRSRRTGFPLGSPVRERAMLWESMSKAVVPEGREIQLSCIPRPVAQSPVDASRFETVDRGFSAPPLIPLALPQLVDADRKEKQRHMENKSTAYPGHLNLQSPASLRQSYSFAQAQDHEKQRPSIVRTKIRDLLISRRRKSSAKHHSSDDKMYDGGPTASLAQESMAVMQTESRGSIDEVEVIDGDELPDRQVAHAENSRIPANDGAAESKMTARAHTFKERFRTPAEPKATRLASPTKTVAATPPRGRSRHHNLSPNGRPLSVDQRFTLSPSRSSACGSRGILTFNIKARISPGRGVGSRDDTELFVTADVESDGSNEGH